MYPAKCIQLGSREMISQRPFMSHPTIVVNFVQPGIHKTYMAHLAQVQP